MTWAGSIAVVWGEYFTMKLEKKSPFFSGHKTEWMSACWSLDSKDEGFIKIASVREWQQYTEGRNQKAVVYVCVYVCVWKREREKE